MSDFSRIFDSALADMRTPQGAASLLKTQLKELREQRDQKQNELQGIELCIQAFETILAALEPKP